MDDHLPKSGERFGLEADLLAIRDMARGFAAEQRGDPCAHPGAGALSGTGLSVGLAATSSIPRTYGLTMDESAKTEILDVIGSRHYDPDVLKAKYMHERDKRITPDGSAQYVAVEGAFANFDKDPWSDGNFERGPITDHVEVIIAGGGFGGLLAGARLRQAGFTDIRIIEEGGDFGGTWYWNRYPGAMCDIEAHIYLPLLEELHYAPRHRYAYAAELLEHSQRIGRHFRLYDKACFQTKITAARWLEEEARWLVETDRQDRMTAKFLVLCCGRQSLPKLPGIPGIETFKGHAFHSSRWDYGYTGGDGNGNLTGLHDKRVAVIGTGATAVQIVPAIAGEVKELLVFQRTPSSVSGRGQKETGPDHVDMSVPGWQRARRYNFQSIISGLPYDGDQVGDGWTETTVAMTPPKAAQMAARLGRELTRAELKYLAEIFDFDAMNQIRDRVDQVVKTPAIAEALKPWYRWFCKRPCFHDEYLETFNRPNVRLVDTAGQGVERITEHGIVVRGQEYGVDCLIFATGFEAGISYRRLTGFELYGRDGVELSQHWGAGVRTLHGLMSDKFPNCFFAGGNQQSAAAINTVSLLDEQAEHVAYICRTVEERGMGQVEPSAQAVDEYVHLIRSGPVNKDLVEFYADCTPGYFNAEGKAKRGEDVFFGARYPDGPLPFFRMLKSWRERGDLEGLVENTDRTPPVAQPAW